MVEYFDTDEYVEYIKKNCRVQRNDVKHNLLCYFPGFEVIFYYIDRMQICSQDKLLEVGCGVGRILYGVYEKYCIKPYGIDLSPKIIEEAKKQLSNVCLELKVSSAERIDYPDMNFDKIICWGTFDLTNQQEALIEMSRILNKSGFLLLSGKNNKYLVEDEEAYLAELACIRKNIPNHYTDIIQLLILAQKLGLKCINAWCFRKRGDLALNKQDLALAEMLINWNTQREGNIFVESFYEYVLLFEKQEVKERFENFEGIVASTRSISGVMLDAKYQNV